MKEVKDKNTKTKMSNESIIANKTNMEFTKKFRQIHFFNESDDGIVFLFDKNNIILGYMTECIHKDKDDKYYIKTSFCFNGDVYELYEPMNDEEVVDG